MEVSCPRTGHDTMVEPRAGTRVRVPCRGQQRRGQPCLFTRDHHVTEDEILGRKMIAVGCDQHSTETL